MLPTFGYQAHIILFDGICNLCNSVVNFIIRHDAQGKFKFAAVQSKPGQALLQQAGLPITDFDTFVYFKEEKHFIKSTAALQLLRDLGGVWKLAYMLMVIPRSLRDFLYDRIAKQGTKCLGSANIVRRQRRN
jgi:predicted DCC family thiol-disulfide oxidoreductase YuxK